MIDRHKLAAALGIVVTLLGAPALAADEKVVPPAAPAPDEREILETWTPLPGGTAYSRTYVSPSGERRTLASTTPRFDPRTGGLLAIDLVEAGGALVSDQAALIVNLGGPAGAGAASFGFPDGEAVHVEARARIVAIEAKSGRRLTIESGAAEVLRTGPREVRLPGSFESGELFRTVRPGALETGLVLHSVPEGIEAWSDEGGAAAATVWFEEAIDLPSGWRVEGLDGGPGEERGFTRLAGGLRIVDAAGHERCAIEAPAVYEQDALKESSGRLQPCPMEAFFEGGVLIYRVGAPLAWLRDPARAFPVVFDPALTQNTPLTATTSPTSFSITPQTFFWNAVAVSSASDWDIDIGGKTSILSGTSCDFLVADGNTSTITPTTGTATLFSGSASATIEHAGLTSLTAGTNATFAWGATHIVHLFEVNVSTAGSQSLTVNGVTGLKWAYYAPDATAAWKGRSVALGEFAVGATAQTINFSSTGFWVIVVFEDAGPSVSGTLSFTWSTGTGLTLAANTSQSVSTSPTTAGFTPLSGFWNAVGVFADDWDINIGGTGSLLTGPTTDFLVANGNQGTVTPTTATVNRASGATTATIEHTTAPTTGSIFPGTNTTRPWNASDVCRIYEINVGTVGTQTLTVSGVTNVRCALFSPGTTAAWASRGTASQTFAVATQTTVNFTGTGFWAIAVFRDAAAAPVGATLQFDWTAGNSLTLAANAAQTTSNSPVTATITPATTFWNLVGVYADDWDVNIGSVSSIRTGSTTDFLVADGNHGTVTSATATITRISGAASAPVEHSTPSGGSILPGTNTTRAWGATDICRIFEIFVNATGAQTLTVSGVANVRCAIFAPQQSAAWLSRSAAVQEFAAGVPTSVNFTSTGFWSIAVFADAVTAPSGSTLSFDWTVPNPAPAITTISPSSVTAGSAQFTLTVNGTGFVAASSVQVGGSNRTTTFVSATTLTATIPATDVSATGSLTITVFSPTPGGGTSTGSTLTVTAASNPAPTITTISPNSVTAGSAQFTLTVNGTGFVAASNVRVGGASRTTAFVSATQLTATIPATDVAAAGSLTITVFSPTPGGGTSAGSTLTVNNPAPAITTISPNSVAAGAAQFTLTVNGTGFVAASSVQVNGSSRTTAFVSASQLTATIPATDVATAGSLTITVFSPTPGGGTSAGSTLTVTAASNPTPTITTISPSSVAAGSAQFTLTVNGTGFVATSSVRVNGSSRTTAFVSAAQLTATIPASDVAAAGSLTITVFSPTPGGGTSAGSTLTVTAGATNPVPTITSINPTTIVAGSPQFTLTVNGTGYISGSTIQVGGSFRLTTFVSATRLTATLPATDIATAGSVSITVFTAAPGGGTSTVVALTVTSGTNPAPAITTISPGTVTAGSGAITLTVDGTGFVPGSTVQVNGSGRTTTFVSPSELTAAIPASDMTTSGTLAVTVVNPAPGGGSSSASSLTVGSSGFNVGGSSSGGGGGGCSMGGSGESPAATALLPYVALIGLFGLGRGWRRARA